MFWGALECFRLLEVTPIVKTNIVYLKSQSIYVFNLYVWIVTAYLFLISLDMNTFQKVEIHPQKDKNFNNVTWPIVMFVDHLVMWGSWAPSFMVKLTIIGSDNGLSPGRRQAIIWTNAGILSIGPLGTNFCEISNRIHTFSFKKTHLKMLSEKWWPFCLGLSVLTH